MPLSHPDRDPQAAGESESGHEAPGDRSNAVERSAAIEDEAAGERFPYAVEENSESSFEQLSSGADPPIVREFIDFLRYNKKWWMTPIIVVTLILIGLAILLPSPVAPFIYTLF